MFSIVFRRAGVGLQRRMLDCRYAHECVVLSPAVALVQASDGAAPAATGAGWPKNFAGRSIRCRGAVAPAHIGVDEHSARAAVTPPVERQAGRSQRNPRVAKIFAMRAAQIAQIAQIAQKGLCGHEFSRSYLSYLSYLSRA
jgi:hypothetical protein